MNCLKLPEMSGEDFCKNMGKDDFPLRYGNPVVVRGKSGGNLVCMAQEYYEQIMQVMDTAAEEKEIKYWMFEFSMPLQQKLTLERICAECEMTPDEFFEAAVRNAVMRAETDPEGLRKDMKEVEEHPEQYFDIRLVRSYPVCRGETRAQAYRRKLAEEAAAEAGNQAGGAGTEMS